MHFCAFSCVKKFFRAMSIVKNKLWNRLMCETVEAVLSVRFGLNFLGAGPVEFQPTKFMLKNFTAIMYEKQNDVCDDSC